MPIEFWPPNGQFSVSVNIGMRVVKHLRVNLDHHVERVMGIEPTLFAWEARVLPLNDTRASVIVGFSRPASSRIKLKKETFNEFRRFA